MPWSALAEDVAAGKLVENNPEGAPIDGFNMQITRPAAPTPRRARPVAACSSG